MSDVSFSTEDYQKLCKAIASGALEVQFSDRKVIYRSLKEMMQIKIMMEKSLGLKKNKSNIYLATSKGL
jgi:hypothetical protein